MKKLWLILLAVFGFHQNSWGAQSGNWTVEYFPHSGERTACAMNGQYQSGTSLTLLVFPNYRWGVAFYNPEWKLKKDGSVDVAVFIDGQLVTTGKSQHFSETTSMLMLEGSHAYRALQIG